MVKSLSLSRVCHSRKKGILKKRVAEILDKEHPKILSPGEDTTPLHASVVDEFPAITAEKPGTQHNTPQHKTLADTTEQRSGRKLWSVASCSTYA